VHESEQIVSALQGRTSPAELLVFDDEGHGIIRRPNRIVAWSRAVEFLEEHLVGAA
jgi:dipeptidyl aminopeptidase/acylaminoacyl peptidase